jgi:hypothetical protein
MSERAGANAAFPAVPGRRAAHPNGGEIFLAEGDGERL